MLHAYNHLCFSFHFLSPITGYYTVQIIIDAGSGSPKPVKSKVCCREVWLLEHMETRTVEPDARDITSDNGEDNNSNPRL